VSVETRRWRDSIASALSEAVSASISGSGRLVLLLGEAGIGKTTTARDGAAAARRRGMTVRWSACWADGATVAHAPWLTLLSGLGQPGRRAIDSLVGSDIDDATAAGAARASAYGAVISALEEAAAERPIMLVLDDLHWADAGTLQLLDVVASHLPGMPVLVIGTYRDTDVAAASPLTRLGGGADRMTLRGLDHDGVVTLLGDQLGAARACEVGAQVIRLTGGNPFLVVQIARLLADEGRAASDGVLAPGARDLLQQRLGALDGDDRAMLAAAGVLGTPFRTVDLEHLTERSGADVTAMLDRAAALRIVERAAGTGAWAFVHDLFRHAALDGRSSREISQLHRRAATVLERSDAEPSVIAAHLLAAGADHQVEAADWSVRAGDRALGAMAWEEAASHYEQALTALESDGNVKVRADALAGLGRAMLLAGDEARAGRSFDALAALARSCQSPELLARAALGFSADLSGFEVRLFHQGQIDLLEEAARVLDGTGLTALRALVLARLSVALSLVAPDSRRLELAETAVRLARQAGDAIVLARSLAAHCDAISGPDYVSERCAEATEIIAIAEEAGDGPLELLGRRLRYVARLESGDVAGVEEDTGAFGRRAAALGNPLYSWYVPLWRAQMALVAGDVEDAEILIAEADSVGRAGGSTNGPMLAAVLRLAVAWHRGDYAGALAAVAALPPELVDYLSSVGSHAWANALAGRNIEAAAFLDRAVAIGLDHQVLDAEWLPNMVNLLQSAATLGHPILIPTLTALEPYAHLMAFEGIGAGLYGSVARMVAIGCSAVARHDDAVRYAEQALVANRAFGGVLVADSYRTLADCLLARGDDGERAEQLHRLADAAYLAANCPFKARSATAPPVAPKTEAPANRLQRQGEVWHVRFNDTPTVVKHSKGMADLAQLLARPDHELHITELEGIPTAMVAGHGGDALDRRTIAAYKERLTELAEEIDDGQSANDIGRAERARIEYDALVEQLSLSLGLGGRSRPAGPEPLERLRKAVSARIRDAIRRIQVADPALGRHLGNAIHTGVYCSYRPEPPALWRVEPDP